MADPEPLEALARFGRRHRPAVVGEERAAEAALLDGLTQPMHERLGGFGEIPLRVTTEARAIVEKRQEHGRDPGARRGQDFEAAVMEVGVPEPAHVLDFITADLTRLPCRLPAIRAGAIARGAPPLAQEPLGLHVAPHRRVRGQRAERRVRVDEDPEIVDVQLITPAAVGGVLRAHRLTQPRADRRLLPGIAPQPAAQPAHGVGGGVSGVIVPALQRREREAHRPAADRMLPLPRRQRRERRLQRAFRGRGRQERADDREAQMRPSVVPPSRALVARHRAAASWRPVIGPPASMARSDGIGAGRGKTHPLRVRREPRGACPPTSSSAGRGSAASATTCATASPSNRSSNPRGRSSASTGRANRDRAAVQKAVWTKASRHHRCQRASVRALTPRSACRRDTRQGVGPWRSTQASRTTAPR